MARIPSRKSVGLPLRPFLSLGAVLVLCTFCSGQRLCCVNCVSLVLQSVCGDGESTKVHVAELKEEVQILKKVNRELYEFSSQLLTKPT